MVRMDQDNTFTGRRLVVPAGGIENAAKPTPHDTSIQPMALDFETRLKFLMYFWKYSCRNTFDCSINSPANHLSVIPLSSVPQHSPSE